MKISFHGADRDVTGSCHLVEVGGTRVLVDCGMFQGGRRLDEDNSEPFGFDPRDVDIVLLTHAHLDHCGRLPLLVKRGFRGEIVTTAASRELARVVLLDSASLHEEEAKREERTAARRGEDRSVEPLYTTLDALNTFEQFGRTANYGEQLTLAPNLYATFLDAGHILGSATIILESTANGTSHAIAFSGDSKHSPHQRSSVEAYPAIGGHSIGGSKGLVDQILMHTGSFHVFLRSRPRIEA